MKIPAPVAVPASKPVEPRTTAVLASVTNATKSFGNTAALKGINLDINSGEAVGLLGPNGAGKSTLMRAFATLQTPTEGAIRFGDVDVLAEPERLRRTLGYLPQD
ncbi:MAG TPA: ATP-binding cassette domain-containing protein, partial [Arthrobacter sp.]|nr:ATP-binding cassette domain-containing protein [Arthrobacter sp.]